MALDALYLVDLSTYTLAEGETGSWIHALPVGSYNHPVFGALNITPERVQRFASNVKNKVRGIDLSINSMHGDNGDGPAKGWVKDADARQDGVWLFVEWTKDTIQEIKEKKWRYFSAEFKDSWESPEGKKFTDVLFGGALTNRPFMKNLLPINLSENTINSAIELAAAIDAGKRAVPKEEDVDLKKLNELLGLPEDTDEATAMAKLSEIAKPKDPETGPKGLPSVPTVKLGEELKALAESNPLVQTLIDTVDAQNKALAEHNQALREADVSAKLAEFDKSKIVLTPKAKDLVHDLLMDMPTQLHEPFWTLLTEMRKSTSFMVELGERAGTNVRYGRSKDAKALFLDEANRIAQANNISLNEAMSKVAEESPELYNGYRQNSYTFAE